LRRITGGPAAAGKLRIASLCFGVANGRVLVVKDRAVRRDQAPGKDLPVPGDPKRMASALIAGLRLFIAAAALL
jgi:hypothetical protein